VTPDRVISSPGADSPLRRDDNTVAGALVNRPEALPLDGLDLTLRHEMRSDLKQPRRDVDITFVFGPRRATPAGFA
jgi:ABC-type Fe3+/spermidine/putrescine transport system ATPase subunit